MTFLRSACLVPPSEPVLLVVVTKGEPSSTLAHATVRARRAGAGLLIALPRPRNPFTTDAAVARHAIRRLQQGQADLRALIDRQLAHGDIRYEVVPLPYCGTRSPYRQERRIIGAARRLARRWGATLMTDAIVEESWQRPPQPEPATGSDCRQQASRRWGPERFGSHAHSEARVG